MPRRSCITTRAESWLCRELPCGGTINDCLITEIEVTHRQRDNSFSQGMVHMSKQIKTGGGAFFVQEPNQVLGQVTALEVDPGHRRILAPSPKNGAVLALSHTRAYYMLDMHSVLR